MTITVGVSNITFPDSTTQSTAGISSVFVNAQKFTSSGTFTIPSGVTGIKVTCVGAGGGNGGPSSSYGTTGGGGGGGACATQWFTGLTAGNTLTVTVGSGGAIGATNSTGGTGGTTSVSSGSQSITTVSAGGGSGGLQTNAITNGGGAGSSTVSNGLIYQYGIAGFAGTGSPCCPSSSYTYGAGGYTYPTGAWTAMNVGSGGSYIGGSTGTAGRPGLVLIEW